MPIGGIARLSNDWTPDWEHFSLCAEDGGVSFQAAATGIKETRLLVLCGRPEAVVMNGNTVFLRAAALR